jgi:hypothetical protein
VCTNLSLMSESLGFRIEVMESVGFPACTFCLLVLSLDLRGDFPCAQSLKHGELGLITHFFEQLL